MTAEQDKPDKFMEILCAPERGPVEWERDAFMVELRARERYRRLNPGDFLQQEPTVTAYRIGLVHGMAGMRSLECHGPDDWATAYALGWMRGTFPRPFAAEDAEAPASDDSDA